MAREVIRAAIRGHTSGYRPRLMVAQIVSHETGCTVDEALDEMAAMVADHEAVWRSPVMPHRIRSVRPPQAPAEPGEKERTLWTQ